MYLIAYRNYADIVESNAHKIAANTIHPDLIDFDRKLVSNHQIIVDKLNALILQQSANEKTFPQLKIKGHITSDGDIRIRLFFKDELLATLELMKVAGIIERSENEKLLSESEKLFGKLIALHV